MNDRYTQIRYMAANYSRLQGLRALPMGMLLIYVSIWSLYNQGSTAHLDEPILVAITAALLYWLTDRYYNRAFGQVKQTQSHRRQEWIASAAFGILGFLAFVLDTARALRISTIGLVFAACFFEYLWRTNRSEWRKIFNLFPENVTAAALITVLSILPLFGIAWWEMIGIKWQLVGILMTVGIVIIVTGIWSHIRIARSLSTGEAKNQ